MTTISILSKLDMEIGGGLVQVGQFDANISISEILALEEAKKFQANYVYFRRFENSEKSVPQVYIYENDFSDEELVEIHRNLWSSGIVPLFYVITDSKFKIFNCTKPVQKYGRNLISRPFEEFSLATKIQSELNYEKYSAKLFDNGIFWERHSALINVSNSAYQKLLDGLLRARRNLEKRQTPLSDSTINKLLIIGVLVRYLEEKEDSKGVKLLEINRDFYQQFSESFQFTDILRNGQTIEFLHQLDLKFNGKLFDLKNFEKQELAEANLDYIAAIFDANIDGNQFVFWKLYSFNHLPIELISGIYEAFLKKGKGVVYTPPYLVNALIDECMPLYKANDFFENETFKILDPSCGSGIFLVAALKRMIQWKAILHYQETGVVAYPDVKTIQRIIKRNIFGIDLEEGATLVSIFSLNIAICDKLSPMQIWTKLRFQDLGKKNIQTTDFFKIYNEIPKGKFDLVIGNPPFNPSNGFNNKSYLKFVKKEYQIEPSHPLNDDNLALLFWDKATSLRKKEGKICFILPSGAWLYNNNSIDYRSHYLANFSVDKIYDFTHLSDKLFHGKANVAVCATIATDKKEVLDDILHIVVKRNKVAEERLYFEIDHYDFHSVKYQTAIDNAFVWKANLLGGGRLLRLINYLGNLRSLGKFLEQKSEKDNWVYGEGYIIGHKDNLKSNEIISNGRTRKFYDNIDWITGKQYILTKSFSELSYKTEIEREELFEWPRKKTKNIFKPPHIIIKENLGKEKIPMIFSEKYLCFKDLLIGIHAPNSDKEELKFLYKALEEKASLNRLVCICKSGKAGINFSNQVLLKKDIMNLPYPKEIKDLELSQSETIIQNDLLNYYLKLNSASDNSPLNQIVKPQNLNKFGETFCKTLNPIYEQNGQKWFIDQFVENEMVVAAVFCYGKPTQNPLGKILKNGLDSVEKLIQNNQQSNIRITRIVKSYLHINGYDVLILIKPKTIRYWLQSIALRDADETFSDLKRTGF